MAAIRHYISASNESTKQTLWPKTVKYPQFIKEYQATKANAKAKREWNAQKCKRTEAQKKRQK